MTPSAVLPLCPLGQQLAVGEVTFSPTSLSVIFTDWLSPGWAWRSPWKCVLNERMSFPLVQAPFFHGLLFGY
jgi:hypothetical protein